MSIASITTSDIVGMGAEGIAETLVVGLLTSQGGIDSLFTAGGGTVNGTVRAGMLDEGTIPQRPRIVANILEDESDMSQHPRLAAVTVSVVLETWARGNAGATARADGDHVGTDAIVGEKMRQTIREALVDQNAWDTYLAALQADLGGSALGFSLRRMVIESGATEIVEEANTRDFETRLRMLLEAATTWGDVVIPGGSSVTINIDFIIEDVSAQIDGTETVFTASTLQSVDLVFRNGVKVEESEVTIADAVVTFVEAPQVGVDVIELHGYAV